MPVDLLLEIGTEEIPAGYLKESCNELKRLMETFLKENRITRSGELINYWTPRRLILLVKEIAEKQEDTVQEVTGPPKRAAFDKEGNPTKAAIGFARKYNLDVKDVGTIETSKGEYLYVKQEIRGRLTKEVLSEIIPRIIAEIPWPKSMRWSDMGFPFARPIHWIVALLGEEIIPFELAGVKSGNRSQGHRFMGPGTLDVTGPSDYFQKIKESFVMFDPEERKREISKSVIQKAKEASGMPVEDPQLLEIVTNLVEFPSAVCGIFDNTFLALPDPVLITAMREHQKYFAVHDGNQVLLPNFIAVNNTIARDESVVRKGHERVLRARLSDAAFFFKEDRNRPLEERLEDLKKVIYQAELGTSFDKVKRFTVLAEYLSKKLDPKKIEEVRLASRLCKCDLVTEIVMEFPTLQGVIGMEYARLDGHPEEVCLAVHEHYLPAKADDDLPETITGSIVGMADRMDTIAGCFVIGLEPTGAADPFALRRHALAIIRILESREWDLSLRDFINESLDVLEEAIEFERDQVFDHLLNFFRERFRHRMSGAGYETDLIEAVLSATFDRISQIPLRIEQLKSFIRESEEFKALALTVKRVSNILKKQEGSLTVNPELFREPCELALWDSYEGCREEIRELMDRKKHLEALNLMVGLRKPVDDFFEGVEVLTKQSEELKKNRLAVLQHLAGLFLNFADFSKFSI